MILIRNEAPQDTLAIDTLHRECFGRPNEADLVTALRGTNFFSKELSFVATNDDEIVGHILFTRIVIKDAQRTYPVLALAPIAVKPAYQNQGIAKQLITEGMRHARHAGHKAVITVGALPFFESFGFERAVTHQIIGPSHMSEDTFLVASLSNETPLVQGTVYYPTEFNTHYAHTI